MEEGENSDLPTGTQNDVQSAKDALTNVGREILDPVGNILEDQATRVYALRSFVRNLDSNYLRTMLAVDGAVGLVLTAAVFVYGLADAWMFVFMEFFLLWALLLYVRASTRDYLWRRWIRGMTVAIISGAWAFLLYDRIPAEPNWGSAIPSMRPEIQLFWIPIIGHIFVSVGVLIHLAIRKFIRRLPRAI